MSPGCLTNIPRLDISAMALANPTSAVDHISDICIAITTRGNLAGAIGVGAMMRMISTDKGGLGISISPRRVSIHVPVSLCKGGIPLIVRRVKIPLRNGICAVSMSKRTDIALANSGSVLTSVSRMFLPIDIANMRDGAARALAVPMIGSALATAPAAVGMGVHISGTTRAPTSSRAATSRKRSSSSTSRDDTITSSTSSGPGDRRSRSSDDSWVGGRAGPYGRGG